MAKKSGDITGWLPSLLLILVFVASVVWLITMIAQDSGEDGPNPQAGIDLTQPAEYKFRGKDINRWWDFIDTYKAELELVGLASSDNWGEVCQDRGITRAEAKRMVSRFESRHAQIIDAMSYQASEPNSIRWIRNERLGLSPAPAPHSWFVDSLRNEYYDDFYWAGITDGPYSLAGWHSIADEGCR